MPDFPAPRSEIPQIEVSQDEYLARKFQVQGMVERMVQEYEEYSEVNKRHINTRRWKHVGSRERCKLYRERPKYQSASTLGLNVGNDRKMSQASYGSGGDYDDNVSESSYGGGPVSSRSSSDSYGSSGRTRARTARSRGVSSVPVQTTKMDPTNNAQAIADTMPKMLMIGERPGRLEDAMHALVARNHEELAFAVVFLHKEVADCAILHTMEGPTEEQPYRWLGYKWFVKPSPAAAISSLVKHRDNIYLEYTGITTTQSGEILGYHIMHSIDIDGFPDFHDRNCIRTSQSMCSIYYQKEENMVEFFFMGNVDVGGTIAQSPLRNHFVAETMFGMPRSIDAGESKRLTQLVLERRRARAASGRTKLAPLCRLCRSEKKSFNMVTLVLCEICGHTVCTRCRVHKEVFESEGLLGRFNKFDCCKTCVVDISNTHLPPAKPSPTNRHRGPSSVHSHQSSQRSRNWTTTAPSTLYEDEIDEDGPEEEVVRGLRHHRNQRSKLSVASTGSASTAGSSDFSSSRTMPSFQDMSIDSRDSGISDISEFDRSFAIIKNAELARDTVGRDMGYNQRDTTLSRDTAFSIDELEDDWKPDFSKSQINSFSKSQLHDKPTRSQLPPGHQHDMVLYSKSYADKQNKQHDSHLAVVPAPRGNSRRNYEYSRSLSTTPTTTPPNIQRHHSAGSDYSRDDLINRMQHLAQLAEATYHTTQHNQSVFNAAQANKKQPIENRNRFFYY